MQQSILVPLILAVPLAGSALIWAFRRRWPKAVVQVLAPAAVLATFLLTLAAFAQLRALGPEGALVWTLTRWELGGKAFAWGLRIDALAMWWLLVITGVGFLIHAYSVGYMADDPDQNRFFAKLVYFIFAMSLLVLADNFLGLLIGWTNVGLASYMLIGFYIERPAANAAQMKAYLTNLVGEVFMILGIGAGLAAFGTLTFADAFAQAQQNAAAAGLVATLVLVGACAKSAQLPLHIWLPDAMQGPTPVSAMLHAATMVTAGVYLVARLYPLYQAAPGALELVAWVGALSALVGALIATRQYDIKKVLAYSTMSQIGYMFLGNGVGAHGAAAFHFMTHAFFKAALFLGAGIVIHHLHGEQDIRKMGGLWRQDRFSAAVFAVGCAALIGLPPLSGFFSKDEILGAALTTGHYALFAIGLVAAGLTAFYNTRLFALVFLGDPMPAQANPYRSGKRNKREAALAGHGHGAAHGHGGDHGHGHGTAPSMVWPVAVLAVLSVVGGALKYAVEPFLGTYFAKWHNPALHEPHHAPLWAIALVLGVALVGMAAGWVLYGPSGRRRLAEQASTGEPAGLLGKGFYVDEVYQWLAIRPVREALAPWVAQVADARVVDGAVNGLAGLARAVGSGLGNLHGGLVRRYGLVIFAGAAALVTYFAFYVQ